MACLRATLNQEPEQVRIMPIARTARAFLHLEFTCSQGNPREGLDVDSRTVRRTELTPAARAS